MSIGLNGLLINFCLDRELELLVPYEYSQLKSLSIKNPYELELIHSIPSNDIEELEKALHEQFKAFRTHSEWFELPIESVQEFCTYQPQ